MPKKENIGHEWDPKEEGELSKKLKGDFVENLEEVLEARKKELGITEPSTKSKEQLETEAHGFKYDKTKADWELEKNTDDPESVNFEDLELTQSKGNTTEDALQGYDANLGQKTAEYLLENQHLIPEDLEGKSLLFPGSVWREPIGRRAIVPYLDWVGGRWNLDFLWLDGGPISSDHLVRFSK